MVSKSKEKRLAKREGKGGTSGNNKNKTGSKDVSDLANGLSELQINSNRSAAGTLVSHIDSRDIKIELYSLSFYSNVLINESTVELNYGQRYGLIGENGCGKSTFLKSLAYRDIGLPRQIDVHILCSECEPTEKTAINTVIESAEKKLLELENQLVELTTEEPNSVVINEISEQISALDADTFESRAAYVLAGLGFSTERMQKKLKDLSGGWRMRVALARALFADPELLILDEPTNHLDLGACVWLEEYLSKFKKILLMVSHSQDFLNNVCTNIIELTPNKKLEYYSGNYDIYINTKSNLEANQMKAYDKQQEEIAHTKKFIASCGTYSNLVRQGKSRQKLLDKMEADGLVEKVVKRKKFSFQIDSCGQLPPPAVSISSVSFSYPNDKQLLYDNVDFGIDTESRIALVGPNGAGKSTLLKLITGELMPTKGIISRHLHLKIGKYTQHSADQLDLSMSAVEFLRSKFSDHPQDISYWRQQVGKFGLTSASQLCPMSKLSDGQRARVVFCLISLERPNLLLLDEPTNPLDITTIDSLASAIKTFNGGLVLVSHDFRLIDQVAELIYVCENGAITRWDGDIKKYKEKLRKEITAKFK